MLKRNLKFLLTIFLILSLVFSFSSCFAETTEDTQNQTATEASTDESSTEEASNEEIYNGDLYLFDTDVVMDKLVDGNVFICGNNVEITGQINGNLFVCANQLSLNNCYVRYSVFACANSIYYNGACNDLYATSSKLEMTYDSYVVRDVKAASSDVIFKAAIGRDVDLNCNSISLGEDENIPVIYGNLRYSANSEIEIPDGVLSEGTASYTNNRFNSENTGNMIMSILLGFLTAIATALVIYCLTKIFTPKFAEKVSNEKLSVKNIFKYLGIGLLSSIVVLIITFILILTQIGVKLSFVLVSVFVLLCLISVPVLAIIIANMLKPVFKVEKKGMFYLVLILVSVILYGITLIPYAGFILSVLIKCIAIGLLVNMFIPKKELSDEEKAAIEEVKKQNNELKEKRKKEKLEAKEAKKKEKEGNKNS